MKIFESAKKNLASIDLDANQRPLHRMQLLHVVQGFLAISLQCLYLVFEANTAKEYMNSISMTTIGILVYIAYWSAIFQTSTIFEFIDHYETIVNGSEWKHIHIPHSMSVLLFRLFISDDFMLTYTGLKYLRSKATFERTNELTEKLCKIIYFLLVYVTVPGFVLPKAIYCFFIYFTTDLGNDAFELSLPTWLVFF